MLGVILELHDACLKAAEKNVPLERLFSLPVREKVTRMRYVPEEESGIFDEIHKDIETEINGLSKESRSADE